MLGRKRSCRYSQLIISIYLSSSFLFALFPESDLPMVYGGEYKVLAFLIRKICRSWISVGLMPAFVFDGEL